MRRRGLIGLAVAAAILLIGPLTGGSLNPARTFGPLVVSTIGGGDDAERAGFQTGRAPGLDVQYGSGGCNVEFQRQKWLSATTRS
mgnify:CR=1 FL=1